MRTLILTIVLLASAIRSYAGMDFAHMSGVKEKIYTMDLSRTCTIASREDVKKLNLSMNKMVRGKYKDPLYEGWAITASSLEKVSRNLGFDILEHVIDIAKNKYPKMITVVDWGCGEGRTLDNLGWELETRGIKNVRLIGYSNMYFPAWRTVGSKVKFLFDDSLLPYFKEGTVDFVYSYLGIIHARTKDTYMKYLDELNYIMKVDGILITDERYVDIYDPASNMTFPGWTSNIDELHVKERVVFAEEIERDKMIKLKKKETTEPPGASFYCGSWVVRREEIKD